MAEIPLLKHIEAFAAALTAEGKGDQTVANYTFYLRRFVQATGARSSQDITPESVEKFQAWLRSARGQKYLRPTTANYHLTALRTFLKYLAGQGLAVLSPASITLELSPRRAVTTMETPGFNRLLNFPLKMEGREILQTRDRAILELLGTTGMRVGEITKLNRDHVVASRGELAIPSRGGKLRVVPLGNQARYWIQQYLKLRADSAPQLFVRHDPARRISKNGTAAAKPVQGLTPRSIQRLIKKYAQAAGLGRTVQPRTIRHTVAANLIAAGNDLETVRQRLGHASLASTKFYTHPPRSTPPPARTE